MRSRLWLVFLPLLACDVIDTNDPNDVGATRLSSFEDEATVAIAVDHDNAFVTTAKDSGGSIAKVALDGSGCAVLATVEAAGYSIALDDEWIYFPERARGSIHRIKKTGGPVETIAEQPERANGAEAVALDDRYVYWTSVSGVFRAPKTGGAAQHIAEDTGGPTALAVDSGEAFWIARGTTATNLGAVYKVPTSGGPKIELASAPIFERTSHPSIAVSGDHVFVPDPEHGRVYSIERTTGEIRIIADHQASPRVVAVDGSRVYWATTGNVRTVASAPLLGGPIDIRMESRMVNVFALAVNERGAFFTDYVAGGSVYAAF